VTGSVEETQGDQVVGGAEPVGDAGEQLQLGVDALGSARSTVAWINEPTPEALLKSA
jgi:hypothetical protein